MVHRLNFFGFFIIIQVLLLGYEFSLVNERVRSTQSGTVPVQSKERSLANNVFGLALLLPGRNIRNRNIRSYFKFYTNVYLRSVYSTVKHTPSFSETAESRKMPSPP